MIYTNDGRVLKSPIDGPTIHEPCVILRAEMVKIADTARIDSFCKIEGGQGVYIGEHVHIASFSHLNIGGGELVFGAHSGCSSGVKIISGMCDLAYQHISAAEPAEHQHPIRMKTVIGRYVVIFTGAIILPGVTIGDYAVIGAGSVVTKDVSPFAIMAGNPAKLLRWRGELMP